MHLARTAAPTDQAAGLRRLLSTRAPGSIAVTAASPSAGHSAVAAELALALTSGGLDVVLLDAGGGPGGTASLLGAEPAHDLLEAVRGGCAPPAASVQRSHGLRVVQAHVALALAPGFSEREARRLVDALTQLCAQADAVMLDADPGMMAALPAADRLVVVTRDDPDAVMRTYALLKRIAGDLRRCRVYVAINGVRSSARADKIFGNLALTASQFLSLPLECMGQIPDDEYLQRAAAARRPLMELFPASPAALALRRCADTLLAGPWYGEPASQRFPERLLEALRATPARN